MRALELSLRNYRVFEEVDLELPARVIGVFGAERQREVDARRVDRGRPVWPGLRPDTEAADPNPRACSPTARSGWCSSTPATQYEVRRQIRGKNHSTDAELLARTLQLAVGVTEVDAEIRRLLRMDRQVFRAERVRRAEAARRVQRPDEVRAQEDGPAPAGHQAGGRRANRRPQARPGRKARTRRTWPARSPTWRRWRPSWPRPAAAAEDAEAAAAEAARALTEAEARAEAADAAFAEADRVRAETRARRRARGRPPARSSTGPRSGPRSWTARLIEARERLAGLRRAAGRTGGARRRPGAPPRRPRARPRRPRALAKLRAELEGLPEVDGDGGAGRVEAADAARAAAQQAAADAAAERGWPSEWWSAPAGPWSPRAARSVRALPHLRQPARRRVREPGGAPPRRPHAAAEGAPATAKAAPRRRRPGQSREGVRGRPGGRRGRAVRPVPPAQLAAAVEEAGASVSVLAGAFGDELPDVAALEIAAARAGELDRSLARLEADAEQLDRLEADQVRRGRGGRGVRGAPHGPDAGGAPAWRSTRRTTRASPRSATRPRRCSSRPASADREAAAARQGRGRGPRPGPRAACDRPGRPPSASGPCARTLDTWSA